MEKADAICVAGRFRSAPVDANGGLAAHVAPAMRPEDLLFAIASRFSAQSCHGMPFGFVPRRTPNVGTEH